MTPLHVILVDDWSDDGSFLVQLAEPKPTNAKIQTDRQALSDAKGELPGTTDAAITSATETTEMVESTPTAKNL